jgi:plasmid stabilization system protein ParE
MNLIISPRAFRDVEEIRDYLHSRNPQAAKKAAELIEAAIDRIMLFPEAGQDQTDVGVKRIVERRFGYLIYYRYSESKTLVEVITIRHAKRKPIFESS